ncbi:hypothetical protein GCM10027300_41450 [Modestobacter lapidis]
MLCRVTRLDKPNECSFELFGLERTFKVAIAQARNMAPKPISTTPTGARRMISSDLARRLPCTSSVVERPIRMPSRPPNGAPAHQRSAADVAERVATTRMYEE